MGRQDVGSVRDAQQRREFTRRLLADVSALERMLAEDRIERGQRRIGAEQEMFLVDERMRPALVASDVLAAVDDPRLTTELARFNLEANLTPRDFRGDALAALEREIDEVLALVRAAARPAGADVLLTGILPTLRQSDLTMAQMTDRPRYRELNDAICALRAGEPMQVRIKGRDELRLEHDNVMLEACNTSFQLHLQVDPSAFAAMHNLAQLVSGPALAVATNSPLLLKHRLWHETRIALFEGSVDTRSAAVHRRGCPPRVHFGERFLDDSVLEIFREDVARYRVMIASRIGDDPLAMLDRGEVPRLEALCLHNGTVYRWNRACYGVAKGVAHLRIENRTLPSGPTVLDEVANAALYYGLMAGLDDRARDVAGLVSFADVRESFFACAREGLHAQVVWLDGRHHEVGQLVASELLPCAREGLRRAGIDDADIDRYLGILAERVERRQTGAMWLLRTIDRLQEHPRLSARREARDTVATARMMALSYSRRPVHDWPIDAVQSGELATIVVRYAGQIMSEDLFSVYADDVLDLVQSVMKWRHVRHVPVEDSTGRVVGLITHRELLAALARAGEPGRESAVAVADVMQADPPTVFPHDSVRDVISLMLERDASCVLVVEPSSGSLLGIVTERDVVAATGVLVDARLAE